MDKRTNSTTRLQPHRRFKQLLTPAEMAAESIGCVKRTKMTTRIFFPSTFLYLLILSHGQDVAHPQPREFSSFQINTTDQLQYGCTYTVVIKTSCTSRIYTRDAIGIAFGDAYGNQVHAPRLDDPRSRTFERCSTDAFGVSGPCSYQICYLYLHRAGRDGWKPETVTIYAPNTGPITFYYNTFIPSGVWYGFDLCRRVSQFGDTGTGSVVL